MAARSCFQVTAATPRATASTGRLNLVSEAECTRLFEVSYPLTYLMLEKYVLTVIMTD